MEGITQIYDIKKEATDAEIRIREFIRETPLEYSPYLSLLGNCQVFLKLENTQLTGSFKLRGAMNKMLSLDEDEREKGIVTASSGNHGAAVAYALKKLGINGTIYLPKNTSSVKIKALQETGVEIKFFGDDCVKAELFAKEEARKNDKVFISPYNDLKIIGGQATIGIELERQIRDMDAILVPLGGGGLISGIAGYLKNEARNIEIIGCQPKNSPVMYESVRAGKIVDMTSLPTLSDGTAGGIEPGAITFDLCKKLIDDYILVLEKEIRDAIILIFKKHHMLIEGAAALAVASFVKRKERFKNKTVVIIISGAKINLDLLKRILC